MSRFAIVGLLLFSASLAALAQESVRYRPPARDFTVQVHGEHVAYLSDGGCTTTPVSRVSAPSGALDSTECSQSRTRTRTATGVAIDGGALE